MKSNIKKVDTAMIGEKVVGFFSEKIEATARETQFVRRQSSISGLNFLKALVLGFLDKADASLNELAQSFLDLGVVVTAQGVDERINRFSVAFLRAVFAQVLAIFKSQCALPVPLLQQFSAIHIVDSSVKSLPESMAHDYPGCGGKGSRAAMKIQLVFEFLCGNLQQIEIQAGRESDQGYRGYLNLVEPGSLTIVDLGYFCLDAFVAIADKSAYFLSRFFYLTGLLDASGRRISLERVLRTSHAVAELPVQLGCRHALPCRLIILRNPQAVTQKRRRTAKAHAKKRGTTLSPAYLSTLGWTLFITNAPSTLLSTQHIYAFYRIRWQIELIFKLWKSDCGLNQIHRAWRPERVLTELYAKMIGIVIVHFLLAPLRIPDEQWAEREVSNVRFRKVLQRFARSFKQCLTNPLAWTKVFEHFLFHIQRFALKQKRRTQPNTFSLLAELPLPLP